MLHCKKYIARGLKAAGALVLAATMIFTLQPQSGVQPVSAASTLSELQERQKELQSQKSENDKKLDELKKDTAKQKEYKETLNAQIETVQQEIDSYNLEINQLNSQISEKEAEIADKQVSIDENFEKLKERLCALYKAGEASTLAIVLDADNLSDMLRKAEIMKAVTEHDTDLMDTLKSEMKDIESQKAEIQASKEELTQSRTELQDSQQELTELMAEADSLLTDLEKQQKQLEMENESLDKDMQEADAALDEWYAEYYANKQEESSGSNNNSGSSTSGGSSSGNSGSSTPVDGTGQFMWPVPGYYGAITQGFHSGHKGLDISGGGIYGQPIVAADSGYVMFAGFGSAANSHNRYGYCVDIDHGNGYASRYAHCSALTVSTGTYVTKGQIIGYVGNTGESYGSHLHFEIRYYGTPVNPSNFV